VTSQDSSPVWKGKSGQELSSYSRAPTLSPKVQCCYSYNWAVSSRFLPWVMVSWDQVSPVNKEGSDLWILYFSWWCSPMLILHYFSHRPMWATQTPSHLVKIRGQQETLSCSPISISLCPDINRPLITGAQFIFEFYKNVQREKRKFPWPTFNLAVPYRSEINVSALAPEDFTVYLCANSLA
jgi:hypothetical protein